MKPEYTTQIFCMGLFNIPGRVAMVRILGFGMEYLLNTILNSDLHRDFDISIIIKRNLIL